MGAKLYAAPNGARCAGWVVRALQRYRSYGAVYYRTIDDILENERSVCVSHQWRAGLRNVKL